MKISTLALIYASLSSVSFAAVESGKASVDWLSASANYQAGKPIQTGVRLQVAEGWHTYWMNPGEGGMKISVKWTLPAGWTAGELEHPAPKRFMTGELPGFGYEGTVIFPVTFFPPPGFTGEALLKGKISWLTCNDAQCLPGNANLELALLPGASTPTDDAKLIEQALAKVPRPPQANASLQLTENEGILVLEVVAPTDMELDIGACEVFPATSQVVDTAAKFIFTRQASSWTAKVPKSEYNTKPIEELTLVFIAKSGQSPISLTWKSE